MIGLKIISSTPDTLGLELAPVILKKVSISWKLLNSKYKFLGGLNVGQVPLDSSDKAVDDLLFCRPEEERGGVSDLGDEFCVLVVNKDDCELRSPDRVLTRAGSSMESRLKEKNYRLIE